MEQSNESIYLEHSDRIYGYIFLQVRQKELAEDLTQETFYRTFKNRQSFKQQASLSTWLLKIARNATYDYFRRNRIIKFFSLGKEEIVDTRSYSPEDELIRKDGTERLYYALANLKKDYRDVLLLRKINESSIKETAYILGWTEIKVKSTMARAFAALKKEMLEREGRTDE